MILSTNFFINTSLIDYNKLNSEFQLVKYEFPEYFKKKFEPDIYARIIIAYKTNLDFPFYFFSNDKIPSFYVLYPKKETPKEILLEMFSQSGKPILLDITPEIKLHILVKLLLANYFYNQNEKEKRICQGKFYVYGKDKGKNVASAVELSISHYSNSWYSKQDKNKVEFQILPAATDFSKPLKEKVNPNRFPYFEKIIFNNTTYFRQLQPKAVEQCSEIWQLKQTGKRAELDWHTDNTKEQKSCRGYITFYFQKEFISYLNSILGANVATPKICKANKFECKNTPNLQGISEGNLPVKLLETVYVFDNRLKSLEDPNESINRIDFSQYIDILREYVSKKKLGINILPIEKNQLINGFNKPLLLIQDVTKDDFVSFVKNETTDKIEPIPEFLSKIGFIDPKDDIYSLKSIPKQSINVNTNQSFNANGDAKYNEFSYKQYFDYQLFFYDKTIFQEHTVEYNQAYLFENKLDVCFNELLLKHYIINKIPVYNSLKIAWSLPGFIYKSNTYKNYVFIYQNTMLCFDNEYKMQFFDLKKPVGKQKREEVLNAIGLDWKAINDKIKTKYYLIDNSSNPKDTDKYEKKMKSLFLICSPNNVLEIEEPEERILFKYDLGEKRNKQTIEGLKDIWYEETEKIYTVGSSINLNMTVPKANKVRRLDIYFGNDEIKIKDLLETLSYKFVRNKQYTVYPYFFDLIRLYNEIN